MNKASLPKYQAFIRRILGDKVISYYPLLAHVLGGVKNAVMMSQLLYWNNNKAARKRGGWFWKTCEELSKETGLTKYEQRSARTKLEELGVIDIKLKSIPPRWWYRVNLDALIELIPPDETNSDEEEIDDYDFD